MRDFDYNHHYQENMYSDMHYVSDHHHHHSDVHVAHVARPGEDCCGRHPKKDCECVTSADIKRWNGLSALEPLTGVENIKDISALDLIKSSADKWNSNYETVDSNSASWLSAVSSVSALKGLISEISAKIPEVVDYNFDHTSITGDGTKTAPYGVSNYETIMQSLQNLAVFTASFYDKNGKPMWMNSRTDGIHIAGDLEAIKNKNEHQETELNEHDKLIKYLLDEVKSEPDWIKQPAITPDSLKTLTGENKIYYV